MTKNQFQQIITFVYELLGDKEKINASEIEVNSIDDLLDKMEIKISRVEESYVIESTSQELSNKLDIEINHPLLCVKKKFYDSNNEIILISIKHIVTERYTYTNFIKN